MRPITPYLLLPCFCAAFVPQSPYTSSTTRLYSATEPPPVFPVSTRAALIEKAKELDDNLSSGKRTGSYSDVGWSNRLGTVLTPASIPGVYTGDREFIWNSIDGT